MSRSLRISIFIEHGGKLQLLNLHVQHLDAASSPFCSPAGGGEVREDFLTKTFFMRNPYFEPWRGEREGCDQSDRFVSLSHFLHTNARRLCNRPLIALVSIALLIQNLAKTPQNSNKKKRSERAHDDGVLLLFLGPPPSPTPTFSNKERYATAPAASPFRAICSVTERGSTSAVAPPPLPLPPFCIPEECRKCRVYKEQQMLTAQWGGTVGGSSFTKDENLGGKLKIIYIYVYMYRSLQVSRRHRGFALCKRSRGAAPTMGGGIARRPSPYPPLRRRPIRRYRPGADSQRS